MNDWAVISGQWSVGSDQQTQSAPWEGEAPAEPKAAASVQSSLFPTTVARAFLTPRTKCSPSIPARPHPLKNTGDFKGHSEFVPGLKPTLPLFVLSVIPARPPSAHTKQVTAAVQASR